MATRLRWRTQPDGAITGVAYGQQPVVEAIDDAGAVDPTFTANITIAKKYGAGTFAGTAGSDVMAATAGVAAFSGLKSTGPGHMVLEATASGLTAARSGMMTIMPAATAARTVLVTGANATDGISLGSGAGLDNLPASDFTHVCRVKRTGTGSNQFLVAKFVSGSAYWYIQIATDYGEGTIVCSVAFSTTNAFGYSNASNLMAANTWYDLACEWDATAKSWKIYLAPVGTTLAEISGYGVASSVGAGTRGDDAAGNHVIGNLTNGNPFKGHHEWHATYAGKLTATQRAKVQLGFDRMDAAMLSAVATAKAIHQTNATSPLTDHSGNGNTGTVTTATTTTGETPFVPTVFGGAPDVTTTTNYVYPKASYGFVQFSTSATSVQIGAVRVTSDTAYDAQAAISIWVDGVYYAELLFPASSYGYATASLPAGAKTVTIFNSGNSRNGAAGTGTEDPGVAMISIRFNASATEVIPSTPSRTIVTLHDSIIDGPVATPVGQKAPLMALRAAWWGKALVIAQGFGGQTLKKIAVNSATATATAQAVAALGATDALSDLGLNDWSNSIASWTASDYGTSYGDLLDKLIAEIPALRFILVTMPTMATGEGANGNGDTAAAFRTAAISAAAGKVGVTVYDGPTQLWNGTNTGVDGVHPNNTAADGMISPNLKWLTGLDLPFPLRQRRQPMRTLLTL